jgi:eukaryotic-like serine/threonine-protein kinase
MVLTSGTKLGPYEIVALLGAGGMGEVYRARDLVLKREVAIKLLPQAYASDTQRLHRFQQEAEATATLNHPNILSLYHVGEHNGSPYLVTELLEGETLRERLRGGALPVRKAIELGVQVARGLAAAHERGIVHRDLKPENLFVTKDGRVKILDFGLAKLTRPEPVSDSTAATFDCETAAGEVLGTVGYMAPEQVRGNSADARADIFAFGAILYELLSARRAFKGATSADTLSAILKEEPAEFSALQMKIPPAVESVMRRCLEKAPELRFQSALDLGFALEAFSASSDSVVASTKQEPGHSSRRIVPWLAVAVCLALIVSALLWWRRAAPKPEVEAVTQLTNDGEPKLEFSPLATDGSRVYFNESLQGSWKIAQVSTLGGQSAPLTSKLSSATILDISPGSSALLVTSGMGSENPLWFLPLPAGEPHRVGDLLANDAAIFPDSRHIVFTKGNSLYVVESDGSEAHKLLDVSGATAWPSVSPDGKRIRFSVWSADYISAALWEVSSDGTNLRQLLANWKQLPIDCCGKWTPDGKYFVFQSGNLERSDIYGLREGRGLVPDDGPVKLTQGPLSYVQPTPSADGKQIFTIGSKARGELVRYDQASKEFVPYLSGISAFETVFSRDGNWVAFVSYPDHTLWRMRLDGSDRLQLVSPPRKAILPAWSPDGKRIAYGGFNVNRTGVYVVDVEGGVPQEVAQDANCPTWSSDGNFLSVSHAGGNGIRVVDLHTGKSTTVSEADDKFGPVWSPDGRFILSSTEKRDKLMLFDVNAKKWSQLLSGSFEDWTWSRDGRYVYYVDSPPDNPAALRIQVSDGHVEPIISLKGIRRAFDPFASHWADSAPDGSLLLMRDIGTQEIYALKIRWP